MFPRISVSRLSHSATLDTTVRVVGNTGGTPLVFVHGNLATSLLYANLMERLPKDVFAVAYDVRGYGDSLGPGVNAKAGLSDYAEDLKQVLDAFRIRKAHIIGWSLGGGIVQTFLIKYWERVISAVLEAPAAPFGMGGLKDKKGTPCFSDFAGSGGRWANQQVAESLQAKDFSETNLFSVRNVFNKIVWNPPYRPSPPLEDMFLEDIAKARLGPDFYPGDWTESKNFPGFAPGEKGVMNALSPKYMNCMPMVHIQRKPPVLWVRGADDQIVSDEGGGCMGTLGKKGLVKGWPGADIYPPQPMIAQTRYLLELYQQRGGSAREVVIGACGHSPHLEKEDEFLGILTKHLNQF